MSRCHRWAASVVCAWLSVVPVAMADTPELSLEEITLSTFSIDRQEFFKICLSGQAYLATYTAYKKLVLTPSFVAGKPELCSLPVHPAH